MQTSEQINEISAAVAKMQGALLSPKKDSDNPFYRTRYADLASHHEAAKDALAANGLAVISAATAGEETVAVTSRLVHESGQWFEETLRLRPAAKHTKDGTPLPMDPQSVGIAITYGRRYLFSAMVGTAPDDDDGNAVSHNEHSKAPPPKKKGTDYAALYKAWHKGVEIPPESTPDQIKALFVDWLRTATQRHDLTIENLTAKDVSESFEFLETCR